MSEPSRDSLPVPVPAPTAARSWRSLVASESLSTAVVHDKVSPQTITGARHVLYNIEYHYNNAWINLTNREMVQFGLLLVVCIATIVCFSSVIRTASDTHSYVILFALFVIFNLLLAHSSVVFFMTQVISHDKRFAGAPPTASKEERLEALLDNPERQSNTDIMFATSSGSISTLFALFKRSAFDAGLVDTAARAINDNPEKLAFFLKLSPNEQERALVLAALWPAYN